MFVFCVALGFVWVSHVLLVLDWSGFAFLIVLKRWRLVGVGFVSLFFHGEFDPGSGRTLAA
ncbi:hypothetical protein, partial [Gordonia alkanivorans]|uniref:hypothetical protein n=1 Tax=Gordonia alkanivorans TaxID=84096 RepID=UPI002449D3DD